jgi:UDP-glucose 6-dehydrogenase
LSVMCEKYGADIEQVRAGMGSDSASAARFCSPGSATAAVVFPRMCGR